MGAPPVAGVLPGVDAAGVEPLAVVAVEAPVVAVEPPVVAVEPPVVVLEAAVVAVEAAVVVAPEAAVVGADVVAVDFLSLPHAAAMRDRPTASATTVALRFLVLTW